MTDTSSPPDGQPPADLFSNVAPGAGQPKEPAPPASDAPEDPEPATDETPGSDAHEPSDLEPSDLEPSNPVPTRYSIGEVSDRLGLESHVLRYWETEFEQLDPTKDGAGRRVYTEDDIDIVQRIHHLLKEEMYTIAGARAVLQREGVHGRRAFREELHDLRDFLADLRDDL
ncbi:MerR family transcriptional regulator [Longibacter sp.]|uniref:MerR family transcriptional regulator n=1 Tax=Longibacter sp. TaxID=2045415 RepID=UPI003EBEE0FA